MSIDPSQAAHMGDVRALARFGIGDGVRRRFGQAPVDERLVTFHDMRGAADQPTLEREGFMLAEHSTSVCDFEDADEVATVYLPEIRDLIRRLTGAGHVFMQHNWVLRAETKDFSGKDVAGGKHVSTMKTGGFVHLDYTAEAAEQWARHSLAHAGVTERPAGRLLVLTAWRGISPPPQDKPLALLDRRTIDPGSFILEDIVAPTASFTGYQIEHRPEQRFCWWSDMTRDEVILFVQHEDGAGPASGAPHTAFDNPACAAGAPARHSIEVRAYAFLAD